MQLVILAGGFGTRISEETRTKPKPMVKIGNYPIILHIMRHYSFYGVKKFIICLGYKGYQIKDFFLNYKYHLNNIEIKKNFHNINLLSKNSEDWEIKLVDTGLETMTGGRIKQILKYIENDDFFLTYGDGLSNINIKNLYKFHLKHKKLATVSAVKIPSRFGYLNINKSNGVSKFSEKPASDDWINGGFFVLNKKIGKFLKNKKTIWEREPLEKLAKSKQLKAYLHKGFWYAMDNLNDKKFLEKIWKSKKAPWKFK